MSEWSGRIRGILRETQSNLRHVDRAQQRPKRAPPAGASVAAAPATTHSLLHAPAGGLGGPGTPGALVDRLFATQEKVGQLTGLVEQLLAQNEAQGAAMAAMQDEMSSLHRRLQEKGVNVSTERKLGQMNAALTSKMQVMEAELLAARQVKADHGAGARALLELQQEVREMRQACQTDVDGLRMQLGQLTSSVVRLEHDVTAAHTASREAAQGARRVQDDVRALHDGQRDGRHHAQRSQADLDALRADVADLQKQVLRLRAQTSAPSSPPRGARVRPTSPLLPREVLARRNIERAALGFDESDIDLSLLSNLRGDINASDMSL